MLRRILLMAGDLIDQSRYYEADTLLSMAATHCPDFTKLNSLTLEDLESFRLALTYKHIINVNKKVDQKHLTNNLKILIQIEESISETIKIKLKSSQLNQTDLVNLLNYRCMITMQSVEHKNMLSNIDSAVFKEKNTAKNINKNSCNNHINYSQNKYSKWVDHSKNLKGIDLGESLKIIDETHKETSGPFYLSPK